MTTITPDATYQHRGFTAQQFGDTFKIEIDPALNDALERIGIMAVECGYPYVADNTHWDEMRENLDEFADAFGW